jgi:hypothetical protein
MPLYRVHILGAVGELLGAVDVNCIDDEAAIERTEEVLGGHGGELWRRVALIQPHNLSAQSIHKESPRRERVRIRDHKQRQKSH